MAGSKMAADDGSVFFWGKTADPRRGMAGSAKTTRLEMWLLLKTTGMKSDNCLQTRTGRVIPDDNNQRRGQKDLKYSKYYSTFDIEVYYPKSTRLGAA